MDSSGFSYRYGPASGAPNPGGRRGMKRVRRKQVHSFTRMTMACSRCGQMFEFYDAVKVGTLTFCQRCIYSLPDSNPTTGSTQQTGSRLQMPEATLDPEIPGHPPPVRYPSRASIALQLMPPPAQFPYMSGTTNQAQTSVLSYGTSASHGTSNPYGISTSYGISHPLGTSNPCGTRRLNSDNYVFCWKPRCRVAASTTATFWPSHGRRMSKRKSTVPNTGSPVKSPCSLTSRIPRSGGQSSWRVNGLSCWSKTLPGQNISKFINLLTLGLIITSLYLKVSMY